MGKKHEFWNTQPVDVNDGNNMIKKPESIAKEAPKLPENYVFGSEINIKELATFLKNNYVIDLSGEHTLAYSEEFLDWVINNTHKKPEYTLTLRWNSQLIAFAFAKEHTLTVRGVKERVVSINFLCVAKELRGRRIAPVMIKEITRRVNLNGIYQAIFTSGTELPFNISEARYFHRALNPKKLYETKFSDVLISVEEVVNRENTRQMTKSDIQAVLKLYNEDKENYKIYEDMDEIEASYNLLPRENILNTYVHEENGIITEFGSYFIAYTIEKKTQKSIKGAYLFYNSSKNQKAMLSDLIFYAKAEGCDVFNSLNIMNIENALKELDFITGTGKLKYYLYNWRTSPVEPKDIKFVLF